MIKLLLRLLHRRKVVLAPSAEVEGMTAKELTNCFIGGHAVVKGVMALLDSGIVEALNSAGDQTISAEKAQLHLQHFNAYTNLKADILDLVIAAKRAASEESE